MKKNNKQKICFNARTYKLETNVFNYLEDYQTYIDGFIESYQIGENLFIYMHEAGLYEKSDMPVILTFKNFYNQKILKKLYGNLIFIRFDKKGNHLITSKDDLKDIEVRMPTITELFKVG